jgi:hypothetical protein
VNVFEPALLIADAVELLPDLLSMTGSRHLANLQAFTSFKQLMATDPSKRIPPKKD